VAPARVGALMFPLAQRFVERAVLVEDAAIREAQRRLWSALRIAAEPGGAAAMAALMSGRYQPAPGERIGIVLCGANTMSGSSGGGLGRRIRLGNPISTKAQPISAAPAWRRSASGFELVCSRAVQPRAARVPCRPDSPSPSLPAGQNAPP
jgi:hypothetical protein